MSQNLPTILIIDDDKMIADAMERALSMAGYNIIQASDGKAGLKQAIELEPDLIILDYNMPEMNGIEVLKKLRIDPWGHTAKIIFATNVYDLDAVNAVMGLDVKDYVMKSELAIGELVALVAKYVKPGEVKD